MCGKPASTEAFLEGARVWLCAKCMRFGKAVAVRLKAPQARAGGSVELGEIDDPGGAVKRAREARRISVGDLAKKIFVNEKELMKIERGELVPSEGVARKLERELGIKLLETK